MYTALYLPARPYGVEDPSKDFDSEEEAWNYIFNTMCTVCKNDRKSYFELIESGRKPEDFDYPEEEFFLSEYPVCSAEWLVVPTEGLDEILEGDL